MFDFIYDETEGVYHLWWDGFPEAKLGYLRQLSPGKWECCAQWQAHFRLGLEYRVFKASSKEDAALLWLTEGQEIEAIEPWWPGTDDDKEEDDED